MATSRKTPKPLLLAAIEAVAGIRPHEALKLLDDLADSDDDNIADAVREAMAMAEGQSGDHDELDDDDDSRSRSG